MTRSEIICRLTNDLFAFCFCYNWIIRKNEEEFNNDRSDFG